MEDATFDDGQNVDQANELRDETIADDRQTEQDAEATATDTLVVGQAQNDEWRSEHDATAWQTWADGWATAFNTYAHASDSALQANNDTWGAAILQGQVDNAQINVDYITGCDTAGIETTIVAEAATALHKYLVAAAASGKTYAYALADAFKTEETLEADADQGFTDTLSGNLDQWSNQNDTLAGADEIAVGTALATQDRLDTGARDDADETAANQAAGEVGDDALSEQQYNDGAAGEQDLQDVSDTLAQQTFETTEADDYMNALDAWVSGLVGAASGNVGAGSPDPALVASATEQYQQAVADDAWVHSVTGAEVLDVQEEDGAQINWTTTVDAAAAGHRTDDADGIAAGIVASDEADKQNAVTRDDAWTTEVKALANATTGYDQASADAAAGDAEADAGALHTARLANRDAWVTWWKAQADANHDLQITGDELAYIAATAPAAKTLIETQAANGQTWVDSM